MGILVSDFEQMKARTQQAILKGRYESYRNNSLSSNPITEQAICYEPLAEAAGETKHPNRICIRIAGFRRRLLDPDNFCPKYFIDCLRYAKIIQDDSPEFITLETSQVKVKTKSEERTTITIEEI
jgi:Holliday junction resolvase RusA-like endonuclease